MAERPAPKAYHAKSAFIPESQDSHDDIRVTVRKNRSRSSTARSTRSPDGDRSTVIIGAGPTGLSACYHLGPGSLLLEKNDTVGGWCRSFCEKGFTFDYAGHIMFSKEPYVLQLYEKLLGENVHWQDREAWIYSKSVYTRYPFQGSLYGLPADAIKECIVGLIEARFGKVKDQHADPLHLSPGKNGSNGNGTNGQTIAQKPNGDVSARVSDRCSAREIEDCCGDGILESTAKLEQAGHGNGHDDGQPRNFEEFIYKVWGRGIAKHFAIPYNQKLWAVPLHEMDTSWLGGRVPVPDLEEMIEGALKPAPKPMGPNARFGYPLRGGFQALMDGFLPDVSDRLRLNTGVTRISPSARTVTTTTGQTVPYDYLISTMPLPLLIRAMGAEAPAHVREAAARLRDVSVVCVHLGIGREKLTEKHWIYYPEDTVFHRIFVQGNASPHVNPPGGFGLTCEITYSQTKPLPCTGDALIQRCIEDCHKVGIFNPDDPVLVGRVVDLPHAYVVYDHGRAENVRIIREWLDTQGIVLAGRYAEWEYYNSDHAFMAGKHAADKVLQLREAAAASAAALPSAAAVVS